MHFDQLVDHVYKWIKEYSPQISLAEPFLLAVSGGVDSMVMLQTFLALSARYDIDLKVVHINHQLRPEASDKEQNLVLQLCEAQNIPVFVRIWRHGGIDSFGRNIEASARAFRYQNFAQIMKTLHIKQLVTAHHMNDQAETVLMRLIHGGRFESITGIKPLSPLYTWPEAMILRPFLAIEKADLYQIAADERLAYLEDTSNQDLQYTRNRMRQQFIPQLEEENANLVQHLADFAQDGQALATFAQSAINEVMPRLIQEQVGKWQIDLAELATFSSNQQLLLLQKIFEMTQIESLAKFSRTGTEDLLTFLMSETPQGEWMLPAHYRMVKVYATAYIVSSELPSASVNNKEYQLILNEWLSIDDDQGHKVGLFDTMLSEDGGFGDFEMIHLAARYGERPLLLRHRQAGDFVVLSDKSHQKLRRYFINHKIPKDQREAAWLLVTQEQEVLAIWTPDQQYAQTFGEGDDLIVWHNFYH